MNISMKLFYQYMAIFFNFSPTSNHLHPLQVENCDSNSRLVVDEDDNGKVRFERVKHSPLCWTHTFFTPHYLEYTANTINRALILLVGNLYDIGVRKKSDKSVKSELDKTER